MTIDELIAKLERAQESGAGKCEVQFARGGGSLMDASEFHGIDEVVQVSAPTTPGYEAHHPTLVFLVQT